MALSLSLQEFASQTVLLNIDPTVSGACLLCPTPTPASGVIMDVKGEGEARRQMDQETN